MVSFFRLFTSAEETFSHCKSEHQFNIDNMVHKHGEYFFRIKEILVVKFKFKLCIPPDLFFPISSVS